MFNLRREEPEDHMWSADHSLRNAGLDDSAIEHDTLSRPGLSPHSNLYNGSRGSSGQGLVMTTHPHLAPSLKKQRTIPLLSPSGTSWSLLGQTLPYLYLYLYQKL
jgi:hypothetical protein